MTEKPNSILAIENTFSATTIKKSMPLWTPLRHSRFRALWIANAISNTGTWMQSMAAAWLMASLTLSPLMTTSIQTMTNLPIFLFALFAGTLADMVDRPKYLLIVNIQMALSSLLLSILVSFGMMTPWLLLILTFALGTGAAFMWPAWQASMSGLVDHTEIPAAATLNGLSYNLASIIGPALGGLLFKLSGPTVLFSINAVSFLGLIIVYEKWRKSPHEVTTTNQSFWQAFVTGFKAVLDKPSFHAILVNTGIILFATSAFASLLPLIVKDMLHLESGTYGLLLGCLGVGAVFGAFLLPRLRARFSTQWLIGIAAIQFGLLLGSLVIVHNIVLLMILISISGIAWVTIVSTLNAAAQSSFPLILRARALSIYMIVLAGGLSFGSYCWGLLATLYSIQTSLLVAGTILILSPLLALKWPVEINLR